MHSVRKIDPLKASFSSAARPKPNAAVNISSLPFLPPTPPRSLPAPAELNVFIISTGLCGVTPPMPRASASKDGPWLHALRQKSTASAKELLLFALPKIRSLGSFPVVRLHYYPNSDFSPVPETNMSRGALPTRTHRSLETKANTSRLSYLFTFP